MLYFFYDFVYFTWRGIVFLYKVFFFEFCLQIVGQDTTLGGGGATVTCRQLGFNDSYPNCPHTNIT